MDCHANTFRNSVTNKNKNGDVDSNWHTNSKWDCVRDSIQDGLGHRLADLYT